MKKVIEKLEEHRAAIVKEISEHENPSAHWLGTKNEELKSINQNIADYSLLNDDGSPKKKVAKETTDAPAKPGKVIKP